MYLHYQSTPLHVCRLDATHFARLEVNPKRIRGEKREQKVEENAEKLIHTAELLWQSLAANINTCPFQILDTIQMVTKLAFFKESKLPGTSQGYCSDCCTVLH